MSSDDVLTQAAQRLRDLATQIDRQAAISVRPGQLEVLERIAAKVRDCADVVHGAGRPMSAPDREALGQIIADEIAEWSIIGERGPLARPIADRLISAGLVRTPEPADTAGQP